MAAKDLTRFLRKGDRAGGPGDDSSSQGPLGRAVVVQAPAGFACGLCRSEYRTLAAAQDCLERCCVQTRLREPVHVLASPRGTHYRCSLCSRVRVHREDALRCFEGCVQEMRHRFGVPPPLASALDTARTLAERAPEDGAGPRVLFGRTTRLARPPLYGSRGGALPGANRDLRGLPDARGQLPPLGGGRGEEGTVVGGDTSGRPGGGRTGHPAGGNSSFDTLDAHAHPTPLAAGEGNGSGGRRARVSLEHDLASASSHEEGAPSTLSDAQRAELARRSEELLLGDVPEGALLLDAAALGGDAAPEAEDAFAGLGEPDAPAAPSAPAAPITFPEEDRGEAPTLTLAEPRETERLGSAPEPTPDAPAAAPAGPMTDAQGNVIYREPGQKPFKRADARYVCTACNSKYFTKNEVEKCFMDHPIRPGSDMA